MYSLVPWRSPHWRPGLYLAVGSFYATTDPEGHVYCELCRSTDYGLTWERVAPHESFIPLGHAGAFDSHTCYAAPPLIDPRNASNTLFYYAGGNGPHSGGGVEHGRADFIGLAEGPTDGLITLATTRSNSDALVVTSTPVHVAPSDRVAIVLGGGGECHEHSPSSVLLEALHPQTRSVMASARFTTMPCGNALERGERSTRMEALWHREQEETIKSPLMLRMTVKGGARLASIEV